ncbi:MAG: ABC transporter permease [Galbitalea sp.]
MFYFVLRRVGSGVVLVVIVTFLTFFLTHLDTSQVAREVLGPSATPSAVAAENHDLGLDRPVLVQYWAWFVSALGGNLGTSYFTDQPIVAALAIRLPITLSILLLAIVLTAVASVLIGVGAALRGGCP